MKKPPAGPEFARFTEAMRKIMSVSKTEMRRRDEEERASRPYALKRGPKPKKGASRVPAS